jgi:hypothetical protein
LLGPGRLISSESRVEISNVLLAQGVDVFIGMHANQVLLEVVESRPELGGFGATGSKTLVHSRFADMLAMHRFLVTIQVVDGGEADRAARTILFDAAILARVAGVVFPRWPD